MKNKKSTFITRYTELLESVLKENASLKIIDAKLIFDKALKEYFEGKAGLYFVSSVATKIYFDLFKPSDFDFCGDPLFKKAISDATEIDWYEKHQNDEPQNKSLFEHSLKSLKKYYQLSTNNAL